MRDYVFTSILKEMLKFSYFFLAIFDDYVTWTRQLRGQIASRVGVDHQLVVIFLQLFYAFSCAAASEKNDALHFAIEEKEVKEPDTAVLGARIGGQIGIVAEELAVGQPYFGVDHRPQLVLILFVGVHRAQMVLDVFDDEVDRRLLAELRAERVGEVVVGLERGVECWRQVEERFAVYDAVVEVRVVVGERLAVHVRVQIRRGGGRYAQRGRRSDQLQIVWRVARFAVV